MLAGLVLVYLLLLGLLWRYSRKHPEAVAMREALRLLPDVLRLVKRLAADRMKAKLTEMAKKPGSGLTKETVDQIYHAVLGVQS